MNRALFFTIIFGITIHSIAQQIPLKGVVTVQNSKTYTGTTQYVKNAEITHPNAKNDVTDDDGKFTLSITGLKQNIQTQISVIPHGGYGDYVVVNEKELQNITLGRVTPVSVFICKKGELEQRQAEMVGINMRKLEERMEKNQKRLQKELDELKSKNDYLNTRYGEIKDSLDIISKNIDKAFERIKEYAQNMTLENLDDKDDNYVKAYNCFSNGELDSVSYYLNDNELELKHQKILQLQEEAKKERELAEILTESARAKEEYSENSLNELLKEWLLLARTYDMKNDYEKTMFYYEKAIHADSLHAGNIFEYANYLYSIREYAKAENYYLQCLEIYQTLEQENPNAYLTEIGNVMNNLANSYCSINEYQKAVIKYEEALQIRRKLAEENPKTCLPDVAVTLRNLATLHIAIKKYSIALKEFEEVFEIYENFAPEDQTKYLEDIATGLNNSGNLHYYLQEYEKALEKYEEALKIRRNLAEEGKTKHLYDVAQTLQNLGGLYGRYKEYSKELEKEEEALAIFRELAEKNPKAYSYDVAEILNNLAYSHYNTEEYPKAIEQYEEAIDIIKTITNDNPKDYLDFTGWILNNLAQIHRDINEYSKAFAEYKEALDIYRKLAEENPHPYLLYTAMTLNNLAKLHTNNKEYSKAVETTKEALDMYRKLAEENPETYSNWFAGALQDLSWYYLFTKEYAQAEQTSLQVLELDNAHTLSKIILAHALLFQNRFSEAETIYKEILQTVYDDNETYIPLILDDFEALEKANVIPENCKTDVEKIRKMLEE